MQLKDKTINQGLIILLIILIFLSLYFWKSLKPWGDLWVNLSSELIGVVITIIIAKLIFEKIESRKKISLRIIFFREATFVFSKFDILWNDAYNDSVLKPFPVSFKSFYTVEVFNDIYSSLDVTLYPRINPPIQYANYIYNELEKFVKKANDLINRHYINLNPQFHKMLFNLINSNFVFSVKLIPMIRKVDTDQQIPRPTILGSYMISPTKMELDNIIDLINWFIKEGRELIKIENDFIKAEIEDLLKFENYINKFELPMLNQNNEREKAAICRMDETKLNQQKQQFENYQRN